MDRHGGCAVEKASGVERCCLLAKKTLEFLALVSFFSFLYSYFSGLSSYNLHFSTLIFLLFAHAMDRKYMFLICNGIVAFLVKKLSFSSSDGFINTAEGGVMQISEMPAILLPENVASEEMKEEDELEDEDDEIKENKGERGTSTVEEVNDASVSTEELNQKIEEFIKKIKEEIRIQAQQQQLISHNSVELQV